MTLYTACRSAHRSLFARLVGGGLSSQRNSRSTICFQRASTRGGESPVRSILESIQRVAIKISGRERPARFPPAPSARPSAADFHPATTSAWGVAFRVLHLPALARASSQFPVSVLNAEPTAAVASRESSPASGFPPVACLVSAVRSAISPACSSVMARRMSVIMSSMERAFPGC